MTFTETAWPKAVLWDMDGTLVDTEPYWIAAETPLVERFGGTWTHEDALGLVGKDLRDSARTLQSRGVDMSVEETIQYLTDRVLEMIAEHGVPFRPGARSMLRELREAGVRTAIVTMSRHRMAQRVADLIDFDAFDVVLGADNVRLPKPYPDPYLTGATALGVDIVDCVAIEDSPNGLAAAIASGAVTIGVPNLVALDGLGASQVWDTLEGRTASDVAALWRSVRDEVRV